MGDIEQEIRSCGSDLNRALHAPAQQSRTRSNPLFTAFYAAPNHCICPLLHGNRDRYWDRDRSQKHSPVL